MKNKSARHKDLNTFKFQPFAERIANIDVDVFHKVGHEYENESEETECYFHQAIENWSILNLTEGFDKFKKEIKAHTLITLPQLILDKERVIQVLLKHLKLKHPLSLQPLLDIVVALAKDLRKEFYQYYNDFVEVLIDILNNKDPDQLEWTFTCLAYLFKFLWRPLLKDISSIFNTLLPLLSSNKPEYINSFAAGSFAFVARKVKDRHTFLQHILKTVKTRKDGVEGCGKLFFEVMHGVNGQFHSCAESILPFLLEALSNEKFHQATLFEILEQVITNIVTNIQPQNINLLWESLINAINAVYNDWNNSQQDEKIAHQLSLLLKLTGQSIEYRQGRLLHNPLKLIETVNKICNEKLPEDVLLVVSQIAILLLLSKNIKLTQEQASGLIRKILTLPNETILLYFIDNTTTFSSFEPLILPNFLKYCLETNLNENCLKVLTKIILKKSPLCQSGINLANWAKYLIDFGRIENNLKIETIMLENLQNSCRENRISSLIIMPHLNLKNAKEINAKLTEIVCDCVKKIKANEDIKNNMFMLNCTVECLVHFDSHSILLTNFDLIVNNLLSRNNNYLSALKTIDLIVTFLQNEDKIVNKPTLIALNQVLATNFSSPYHEIRLFTTHIYTIFENLPQFVSLKHSEDPEVPLEKFSIFTICYRTESIDSQVHTYRDQIQNLEKLNFDKPQMLMCNQTEFKLLPLRYLCGVLYINFKLLWDPVIKIIETHAHGLEVNRFWEIYGEELKGVAANIEKDSDSNEVDAIATEWDFLGDLHQEFHQIKAKPDFINFRGLLWKAMSSFSDIAEAKTRDVSELVLDFIEKEYTKSNSDVAQNWNIKRNEAVLDETQEETNEEEEDEEKTDSSKPKGGKAALRTLLHVLNVLSKVRSPKSMYREPELGKLYFDLLQHKNAEIQKAALDCIMTYKHKYMIPYKDNLYNLIDDKNFKNELTAFKIDKDSGIIQEAHRNELIPIVMRIVFSKMSAKTGVRTGGKSSGQLRRNLILRFLAGCEETEMLTFIQMAFRFYNKFLHEDPEIMIENVNKALTLDKFIPPKRLQSTINLLNVILDQFGGLMSNELLTFILQIVLVIGEAVKGAFNDVNHVHSGYLSILRILRTQSIKIIERFFDQFDRYPWTNKQINAIFNVFVWPYLDKLKIEGIHSPTSLLKLMFRWGSNPRYFQLLVKHQPDNPNQYCLPHILELLLNTKSHITVVNVIEEMFEKMLSLQPDEEDVKLAIPIDNLLPISQNILDRIKLDEKLNYGSCILLPHIPSILEKIKRKLETKSKNVNQRELFILSRISELVWEAEISDNTLKLLLPVVLKRCTGTIAEEQVAQFLTTIKNLLGNVENPHLHLKYISPLFAEVGYSTGRKLLVAILKVICNSAEVYKAVELIEGVNAFDAKWIDQPDFQRRHDTFKEIQKAQEDDKITLELGILLIYNSFYLLKSEKDLSLKENSSYCLKNLVPYLAIKYNKDLDYLLNETVFTLIRNGMKSRNDDFRNETINLLGHLARECPQTHIVLRDLNRYTNKADLEVDFFENITHLQLHRHARALLKFCEITKDLTSLPNIRSLTQFVLPLASHYLCNEKFTGKNSVIDAAIECIGTVCRILPWHQYEGLLKFYLTKLRRNVDHQKQLVRITVVILDAFHYDLSKGHVTVPDKNATSKIAEAEKKPDENNTTDSDVGKAPETPKEDEIEQSQEGSETEVVQSGEEQNEEEENMDELEVDEVLDSDEDDEEEEIEEEQQIELKIGEKISVLCKSTASRVIRTIQTVLLPQLHRALAEMTQHDSLHKINRKKTNFEREEEDLLRVPISLALVKLLQRLPKEILEANLPGIFMKACTFLKSPLDSVRRITRETLQKIMQTLGPEYLNILLGEMKPLLSRGFHVHVLVFTTHAILNCLKDAYKPTDIDKILLTVLQLCQADLFGSLSEEKEVAKIAVKTSEAKSTKSFDTFQILAQFITDKCLMDLILPIKNVLHASHSYKTVHKAQECLRHVALGLVDNQFIDVKNLLMFAYGTASESIPQLLNKKKDNNEKDKLKKEKTDCFIIPKAPVGRSGIRASNVKSSTNTNAHLLIEFGLRLCYTMLKRDKIKDDGYKPFLDPFVVVFQNCLNSKHVKLSTLTLQCLTWLMKYELPSMKEHVSEITKDMFAILHKYASAGLSKGDNFDLVVAAFKAMSVLVRDVKYHTIETDQLKILLLYAEQDMHDHDRQATAFNLLKAIISRKLIVPEIHEVMVKVAELSVTSELDYVRTQSRAVFHQYLMDYPLGDNVDKHLGFYISQLNYEMQYGRESAIEMLSTLISTFPMKPLIRHSGTLFITMGARLVNDEVPECRKKIAESLAEMLTRLSQKERDSLFDIVVSWLKDDNVSHRRLAAQLCGLFVTVESGKEGEKCVFEGRLATLIPLILKQFGLDGKKSVESVESEESARINDHHLFQVLQLLLKICAKCPAFLARKEIEDLAKHIQTLLGYPHDWVRLAASQFLGFVLSTIDIDELGALLVQNKSKENGYLFKDSINAIKSLTLDLCDQLQPGAIKPKLAEQVVKNLVFIARVLQKVPMKENDEKKINLVWLTKRMRKIVNTEVVETPTSAVLRTEAFKWIAGVGSELEIENIKPVLHHLLAPLVREMITTEESNAPLRQLSKEVGNILKRRVGLDIYTNTLSNLQQSLSVRRAERKRSRTQLAVTDPEAFAKKKIKRHEKKKDAKKRKIAERKGGTKKNFKRRKVVDLDNEEIM